MEYYEMVMQSQGDTTLYNNQVTFYTDSGMIGVNKQCNGCIYHLIKGFKGEVIDSNRAIKVFRGTRTIDVKNGTVVWE